MEPAVRLASSSLAAVAAELERCGVLAACRELFTAVWAANVDRYEPDDLGDTAMSLGVQTHQNFITRAERRFLHDELELEETHWHIDGLTVRRAGNVFVMTLNGVRISVMKVPPEHGRALDPAALAKWDSQSKLRMEMAARNSAALGDFRSSMNADVPLFKVGTSPAGEVRDFLLLVAGEPGSTSTAGWLGVPVLGDAPLIAETSLWWDEGADVADSTTRPLDQTTFEDAAVKPLRVTLKPNAAWETGQ